MKGYPLMGIKPKRLLNILLSTSENSYKLLHHRIVWQKKGEESMHWLLSIIGIMLLQGAFNSLHYGLCIHSHRSGLVASHTSLRWQMPGA